MKKDLQIVVPDPKQHREAIYDLMGKSFGHRGYWFWMTHCDAYFDEDFYRWEHSRIGLIDGLLVTHWGVWDHTIRIGGAAVRVAGIGAVMTHGLFRKQGLIGRTARACFDGLPDAGYDLAGLYGVPNMYHRYGFVRAWDYRTLLVKAADLPVAEAPVEFRRFTPGHREDMARLYNRQHAGLTGTAVRPTYRRDYNDLEGVLWNDARGRLAGYVVFAVAQDRLRHVDSAGDPQAVLDVLRRLAARGRVGMVVFQQLHYDGPLARAIRRGNYRLESDAQKSGGPMIRTVNLQSTLTKIAGELERRLAQSGAADWRGELLIADSRERVTLQIRRGKVRVAEAGGGGAKHAIRGGEEIAQLLIGTSSPAETVESFGTKVSGDGRALLDVLFPEQHPMTEQWDSY